MVEFQLSTKNKCLKKISLTWLVSAVVFAFAIGDVYGFYDLNSIKGFNASRASDWTGATYDSINNSLMDFTDKTVTYVYDCGNGYTETFTF